MRLLGREENREAMVLPLCLCCNSSGLCNYVMLKSEVIGWWEGGSRGRQMERAEGRRDGGLVCTASDEISCESTEIYAYEMQGVDERIENNAEWKKGNKKQKKHRRIF